MVRKDFTGQRFGRLIAIRPTTQRKNGKVVWECLCECENAHYVTSYHLTSGQVKSCGCLGVETRNENLKAAHKAIKSTDTVDGTRISMLQVSKSKANTSGHKGVSQNKATKKWEAYIHFKKKKIYLGSFETLEEAVIARKSAEEKYHKPVLEKYDELSKEDK